MTTIFNRHNIQANDNSEYEIGSLLDTWCSKPDKQSNDSAEKILQLSSVVEVLSSVTKITDEYEKRLCIVIDSTTDKIVDIPDLVYMLSGIRSIIERDKSADSNTEEITRTTDKKSRRRSL